MKGRRSCFSGMLFLVDIVLFFGFGHLAKFSGGGARTK